MIESLFWLILEIAVVIWALQLLIELFQSGRSAPGMTKGGVVRTLRFYDYVMVPVVVAILWNVFIGRAQ